MDRITEFLEYLESHIGDAYVWGAQGQNLSGMSEKQLQDFLERREEKPGNRTRVQRYIAGAEKSPLYAFDCSGLILHFFEDLKAWLASDTNANGLYGQCRELRGRLTPSTELMPGDLVFIDNGSRKSHVGVYMGGGMVTEARGRDHGVVKRRISYSYWTHFGRHPVLYERGSAGRVITLTTPMMRGEDIRALQTALNSLGYDCGKADGIAGEKTMRGIGGFVSAHEGVEA